MNHTPWVLTCPMNASNIILFFLLTCRVRVLNFTPLFSRATSTMECRITTSNPTLPPFICYHVEHAQNNILIDQFVLQKMIKKCISQM